MKKLSVKRAEPGRWVVLDDLGTEVWEGSTWGRAFGGACVLAAAYGGAS